MSSQLVGRELVEKALALAGPTVVNAFLTELENQGFELAQWIKTQELSGQVLQNRTGTLRRSVQMTSHRESGYVEVGTNVIYAKVHEFGAFISAKTAAFLTFRTPDGAWHRKKSVTIPARPFMRPALVVNRNKIITALNAAVSRSVQRVTSA
ncbi:MAG: phage virion morphogenesis protein [Bryobacteraceae bacterium]